MLAEIRSDKFFGSGCGRGQGQQGQQGQEGGNIKHLNLNWKKGPYFYLNDAT